MRHLRLGEILVHEGVLRPDDLHQALRQQQQLGGLLGTNLLDLGLLEEKTLLRTLGRQCSAPVVSGEELRFIPEALLDKLPRELVERYRLLPFRLEGNTLLLASMRPGDVAIEDYVATRTALMTRTHVGLEVRIWEALARFYAIQAPDRLVGLMSRLNKRASPTTTLELDESTPSADAAAAAESPSGLLWKGLGETPEPEARVEPAVPVERDETSLEGAVVALGELDRRERIAEVTLAGAGRFLERRLLLAARGGRLIGWRGAGPGLVPLRVHGVNFPLTESPIFLALRSGSPFWLGPLTPCAAHERIVEVFGGGLPRDCLVLPISVRGRHVAYLYADNRGDSVAGIPLVELQRLLEQSGTGLLRYLRRRKQSALEPDALSAS